MDKYELLRLVKNPTEIDTERSAEIRKLMREYPYFQLLYTMNAKTAPLSHHTREASVRVADRKLLKRILTENYNPNAEKDLTERAGEINAFELLAESPAATPEQNTEPTLGFQEPTFDSPDFMGGQAPVSEEKAPEESANEPVTGIPADNFFEGLYEQPATKAPEDENKFFSSITDEIEELKEAAKAEFAAKAAKSEPVTETESANFFDAIEEEPTAEISASAEEPANFFESLTEEVAENEPLNEPESANFFDAIEEEPTAEISALAEKPANFFESLTEEVAENEPVTESEPANFFDAIGEEPTAKISASEEEPVSFFEPVKDAVTENEPVTESESANFFDAIEEEAKVKISSAEKKTESVSSNFFDDFQDEPVLSAAPDKGDDKKLTNFFDDFADEPAAKTPTSDPKKEPTSANFFGESAEDLTESLAENRKEEELATSNFENAEKDSAENFFDDAVEEFFADKEDIHTDTDATFEKADENELIDKFIREEPRLEIDQERAKTEKRDIRAERKTEDNFPATERLAKIYEEQGHIARAIRVYQKLQLKFPEKSAYFADRIEKLNTL